MGGYGSGKQCRSRGSTLAFRQIDARLLQIKGALVSGTESMAGWNKDAPPRAEVNIRALSNCIILEYSHRQNGRMWRREEYRVSIEWTPCHFGGKRPWFLCPNLRCKRRVRILYGGSIFACRTCHRLAYPSQRESPADRAASRANAIREGLGGSGTFFDPLPPKPKGMHSRTYARLQARYARHCAASLMDFFQRFGMMPEEALTLEYR